MDGLDKVGAAFGTLIRPVQICGGNCNSVAHVNAPSSFREDSRAVVIVCLSNVKAGHVHADVVECALCLQRARITQFHIPNLNVNRVRFFAAVCAQIFPVFNDILAVRRKTCASAHAVFLILIFGAVLQRYQDMEDRFKMWLCSGNALPDHVAAADSRSNGGRASRLYFPAPE